MENPWLTVALAPPLKPPIPVGNLSHSPPQPDPPDPPDPLQFPPLPSPLSVENPRSGSSTVPQGPSITVNLPYSLTGPGTLPTPPLPPTQLPSPLKPPLLPQKPPPAVDPQTTPPLAQIPLPTSNSQSGPTPIPAPSVHSQNPPASPSSTPAASSPQVDIAIDPPSMEIDTPSPTKETIIDCSDMDSSSAEVFVLALPAVFKDRPIIISNNHLPPKKPSTLSLNPFCTLP
ncbi:unnamed protein product, partial [Brassica oleracea var. botrytis]